MSHLAVVVEGQKLSVESSFPHQRLAPGSGSHAHRPRNPRLSGSSLGTLHSPRTSSPLSAPTNARMDLLALLCAEDTLSRSLLRRIDGPVHLGLDVHLARSSVLSARAGGRIPPKAWAPPSEVGLKALLPLCFASMPRYSVYAFPTLDSGRPALPSVPSLERSTWSPLFFLKKSMNSYSCHVDSGRNHLQPHLICTHCCTMCDPV